MSEILRSWVEIDLGALRWNLRLARGLIGPRVKLFAVCKADGYGCGAAAVARIAAAEGADALAVGSVEDLDTIRDAGVSLPVLVYPSTVPDEAAALAARDAIVTLHDGASLDAFARLDAPLDVFLKLDCGFGRLGFTAPDWAAVFARCAAIPRLRVRGLYAHVDAPEQAAVLGVQDRLFFEACRMAEQAGLAGFERMLASSRVMIGGRAFDYSAVNPGRMIYGMLERPWLDHLPTRPVVRAVKSRIIQVKDIPAGAGFGYGAAARSEGIRTAVLSSGFADGFGHLGPQGEVLVAGRRAPILGRRGFEHTVIDVTHVPEAAVGSEAVLLGRQGDQEITGAALSQALGMPQLELLSRLARSLPRVYLDAPPD